MGTARLATKKGATLELKGATFNRLALVADKAPGGGTVAVVVGTKTIATISLAARSTTHKWIDLLPHAFTKAGTVKIIVRSAGKSVVIDGLAAENG